MVEKWKRLDSKPLADYRIFKSRQDIRKSPRTGHVHAFYVLESPDWMNVIPITPEGNVVLIHQYRHGIESITLEIPGGLVEPDETPIETARREMLEETGYTADDFVQIGLVTPNPAFMDNMCFTFLAKGARKVAEPALDGSEDIAVVEMPLSDIPRLIRTHKITHSLVVAAFYHLDNLNHENL